MPTAVGLAGVVVAAVGAVGALLGIGEGGRDDDWGGCDYKGASDNQGPLLLRMSPHLYIYKKHML